MVDMPDSLDHGSDATKEEAFMSLFLQSERRILGFILTMIPYLVDAEDLLQETCTVMWRKFDEFEPGTDFSAWGIAIARYRVMNHFRTKQLRKASFSEPMVLRIAEAATELLSQNDRRVEALQACLSRLRDKDRELIRLRYFSENSAKQVAQKMGRSVDSIYRSLNRVHDRLLLCIRHSLQKEGFNL